MQQRIRYRLASAAIACALGVGSAPLGAFAQTDTGTRDPAAAPAAAPTPPRPGLRDPMAERGEERRERQLKAIDRFTEKHRRVYDRALDRLGEFTRRIQAHLNRARERGRDVTEAQAVLDRAKVLWEEAKVSAAEVKDRIDALKIVENPRQAFGEVRTMLRAHRDTLQALRQTLVQAITALKGVGRGPADRKTPPPAATPAPTPGAATEPAPRE